MQYLGEYLLPTNSISKDSDKLTKLFYFRPDKYDDPDADIQNILALKELVEFPKRLDTLSENANYAIQSIEISKKIDESDEANKLVSYIVTASYDLLDNIKKREEASESTSDDDSSKEIDENGNLITKETKPWEYRAKWNFQPIEVVEPFKKAYGLNGVYVGSPIVDVLNSANCILLSETKRYQLEITYQKNYQAPQIWENITRPYTNDAAYDLNFDYRGSFPAGTLLLLPPTYSTEWYEEEYVEDGTTKKRWTRYYSYTVKMIYDYRGHNKELLDVGTYAKFPGSNRPSQIWEVTVVDENGNIENGGQSRYTSAAEALRMQAQAILAGKNVNASPVTEPLPLAGGYIYEAAINDPNANRYNTLKYIQYEQLSFSILPIRT